MFYIYSYYFGIIIFAFYPEAIVGGVLQKGVLKNFAKFARKRLYRSLFLNATSNFIQKKDSDIGVFLLVLRNFSNILFY